MRASVVKIPRKKIIDAIDGLEKSILRRSDFEKLLSAHLTEWELAKNTTVDSFIEYLLKNTQLKSTRFQFPKRTEIRYTWGEVSPLQVVATLRSEAYFSHYTALSIHGLTTQDPRTIYLNTELRPLPASSSNLEQRSIDFAFRNAPRQSKMIAEYSGMNVCLLNSKFSDGMGIIDNEPGAGASLRVTNIERTLIDATVRPFYAGGVVEVLNAFRAARGKVSINKLAAILKKLDFVYPYHQAIGFYLERSGVYSGSAIEIMRQFETRFDFYLTYQLKETEYSQQWRLFYPKGF